MNTIKLLPHNQKIFDEIMEAITNGERSIFYSEATGLGKSFIFMKLVQELFKDKKVLYIVPKIAIWDNLNMYEEFEYIKDNVDMTTYADFNLIKDKHYPYDAIFIDECHHLISDIQGANILDACKDYLKHGKYVFGFTATPVVKKNLNVDSYFNAKIYGLDIIEAIESGLFSNIDYVIALQDTEIPKEYCKKYSIDGTKTILENVMSERSDVNHWLVYFSNIKDLKKNLESIKKILPDYKIFTMYSENEEMNDKQLEGFNNYEGKSMLLTVSMVLEGIHPKNVGGILLYRNITRSNTLLQVLGRICDINKKSKPICIDIPNNERKIPKKKVSGLISKQCNTQKSIRNIIDVKASSYRYIELIYDVIFNTCIKYRGLEWRSDVELSILLGKCRSYVSRKLKEGYTREQLIDEYIDGKHKKYSYRGIEWSNDAELSRLLGKNNSYIGSMIRQGYTREQIIDKYLNNIKYSYKGFEWNYDTELSRLLGKGHSYVSGKLKEGYTREQLIDEYIDGSKYSYRGIKWNSDAELSILLGKNNSYISYKIRQGYTREQIIDKYLDSAKYSYRGIEWSNDAELSRLLGKNKSYVSHAKKYTKEQLIDKYLDNAIYSYRGIKWNNDIELSRLLGKSRSYICLNLKKGYTREQLIDKYLGKYSYRGIKWNSDAELSRLLGRSKHYVRGKILRGYTREQIIDINLDNKDGGDKND